MKSNSSRRSFLATGLSLPAAGLAATSVPGPAVIRGLAPMAAAVTPTYRVLGKTGLKVTSVGFGCMITSDASVVSRALDMGITYFDTARGYQQGNNERMVGACLKGSRDKVVLSSKSQATTKAEALAHLDTSLKELGTDHLDIWYMHGRDDAGRINDECVDAWVTAKKAGKTRFIGASTHNPNNIVDRVLETGVFDVILSTFNFTVGTNNDATYKRLKDAGIGLVAMKVMAPASAGRGRGGRGPGAPATPPPPAAPPEKFLASLKWVLRNDLMSTTIPSMTDMDQLEVNLRAMSEKFGPADEKLLAQLNEEIRPLYCRMCHQCSGQCPKGVPVADTLRYLSYSDFYGQFALGREHFQALPEEIRDVHCGDCSSCAVQCPNGVQVRDRLIRAQEMFA
ncbi:MAG: aldo/keto reductase [Bryobacteraceae bacterium]